MHPTAFARWRLGKPTFSFGFERTHTSTRIHFLRESRRRGYVIYETRLWPVCAKSWMRPQEFPHVIECGPMRPTRDCDFRLTRQSSLSEQCGQKRSSHISRVARSRPALHWKQFGCRGNWIVRCASQKSFVFPVRARFVPYLGPS